jgi:hypothetical protein
MATPGEGRNGLINWHTVGGKQDVRKRVLDKWAVIVTVGLKYLRDSSSVSWI